MNRFDELMFLIEKTSKKEQHRIDNFLKRHKYDPKTRTIETDEVGKDGKKLRVKFNITNGRVFSDYANFKRTDINMPRKTLKRKPMISDGVLKHEEGHLAYKRDRKKYKDLYNKAKKAIYDDNTIKNDHGENPEEYVADAYSATHSKYGKNGFTKMVNSLKPSEKDIRDAIKRNKLPSENAAKYKAELISNEMNLRQKFVNDNIKESTDVLLDIYEAEYGGDITSEERDILLSYLNEKRR